MRDKMDTLKNFLTGLVVIFLSLIIFGIILLTWPVIVGISSIVLSFIVAVLFLLLIFYIIVFVGYIVRELIKRK